MRVTIEELVVADPPEAWEAAGFTVGPDAVCRIGSVAIRLAGRGERTGVLAWTLRGAAPGTADRDVAEHGDLDGAVQDDLDGIPTSWTPDGLAANEAARPEASPPHPNGVVGIDHVVLLSPDLERTKAVLAGRGLDLRRERDGELGRMPIRQAFYRLGEVILEVVGSPDQAADGPSSLWGLTHVVADIDAAADLLGERAGRVKDAVQPGRRITTLRHRELGMSVRTALITPHVKHAP